MRFIQINSQDLAENASRFLETTNAFDDILDWNQTEQQQLIQTPFRALEANKYFAWIMFSDSNEVIGYIDLRAHRLNNDGYYTDWFAVHKDFRSQGLGAKMLANTENFAKSIGARYILIETGDIALYDRTRAFYERHGYTKVGHIPEYYYKDWGMYIYQKQF